jgi:MFS family permease
LVVTCIIFFQPETYKPKAKQLSEKTSVPDDSTITDAEAGTANGDLQRTISRGSVIKQRSSQWITTLKILLVDPLRSLGFIRFPPVLITVYWASLAFGALYILNVSIQKTFAKPPYNFSTIIIGLMYLPNSIGYFITSVAGGKWNDIIMRQAAQRRRAREVREARLAASSMDGNSTVDPEELQNSPLEYRPEDRMGLNAWIAGCLFPLALLMYGWVVQEGVFWFVSCIATFLFGIGSMLVFSVATTMLTEFVPGRSASAVAVNNCESSNFRGPVRLAGEGRWNDD